MTATRRLAAIMAADVAGFSAAMERDEEGTFTQVQELRRKIIEPRIAEHHGRLIKTTGDGFLAEFASPLEAMRSAFAIQGDLASAPLQLRIGLNLGDIIVEESGDVYGDGVNVAARLEGLAEPGGILVSDKILREVEGKIEAAFEDRGEQQVKNIVRPVRAFSVLITGAKPTSVVSAVIGDGKSLPLPDKPSIAVLPFQNMSGDPEQEYFADGMVEDIITGLSINKSLFVIARNSSFAYKGKSPDIRQVGRELGVRYVVEGSVRKAGTRVRITGQLIDAINGAHVWAERFDGDLEDIFDLQDQFASRVIGGIAPSLERAEIERVKKKTDNLQAYDCYLRWREGFNRATPEDNREGLEFARRAVAIDPDFALGHAVLAFTHNRALSFGWMTNEQEACEEAEQAIRQALELDRNDANVLAYCGQTLMVLLRRLEEGASLLDTAVRINPNLAVAWTFRALSRIALDFYLLDAWFD